MSKELEIMNTYRAVSAGQGNIDELSGEAFGDLKKVCIQGAFQDSKDLNTHLTNHANSYMHSVFNFGSIRQHATKTNGDWNIRKFYAPVDCKTDLDIHDISYKEVVRKRKKNGIAFEEDALHVVGIPEGFYSAWKTITRAMDKGLKNWGDLKKTEIDKGIAAINKTKKASAESPEEVLNSMFVKLHSTLNTAADNGDIATTLGIKLIEEWVVQLEETRDELIQT